MTQREFFTAIVNGSATAKDGTIIKVLDGGEFTAEAIEFAKGRISALDTANDRRKNGTSATAKANEEKRTEIFDGMEIGRTYTAKEIAETFGLQSTQKATGLMLAMDSIKIIDFTPTGKKKDMVKGYIREQ